MINLFDIFIHTYIYIYILCICIHISRELCQCGDCKNPAKAELFEQYQEFGFQLLIPWGVLRIEAVRRGWPSVGNDLSGGYKPSGNLT